MGKFNEKDIPVGGIVMMMKNKDGSFSPVGASPELLLFVDSYLSNASEDHPFVIADVKYIIQKKTKRETENSLFPTY